MSSARITSYNVCYTKLLRHFRNGVVLGPASARLMADLVLGREPILDPAPYAVDAVRA